METPEFFSATDKNCDGVDLEVMHPEEGNVDEEAIAKSICEGCSYADLCLGWAIKMREKSGVWGGLTPVERRTVERKRHKNDQQRAV